ENGADGHDFRPNALHGAFDDGEVKVAHRVHAAETAKSFPGMVQVEQHDDASLGIETGEGDKVDPYRHAHVVTEHVEKPKCSYERERHGQQHDQRLHRRFRVH